MTFDRKEYNKKNKEAIAQRTKEYYQKNKEAVAQKNKKYREKNKEAIAQKKKAYYQANKESLLKKKKEDWERNKEYREQTRTKFMFKISNKSRVEDLECRYCGYNYEDWEKKEQGRRARGDETPYDFIDSFEIEHIHSFFVVSKSFDKEAIKNHPIYNRSTSLLSHIRFLTSLPDEYIREYLSISCRDCNNKRIKQDKLDIKNYQDGLDLEEDKE